MRELRAARVGVLALSWYPPGTADQPGANTPDEQVVALLDAAHAAGLAVALHVEPYPQRTAASVGRDIAYAIREYGAHPGLHRDARTGLPVFFVCVRAARSVALSVSASARAPNFNLHARSSR